MRLVDNRNHKFDQLELGDVLICEGEEMLMVIYDTMDEDYPYCVVSLITSNTLEKFANLNDVIEIKDGMKVVCEEFIVLDIVPYEHITLTAE